MSSMTRVLTVVTTCLMVVSLPFAAEAAATSVDTKIARVALFKNGLAFFIRQGKLPARPGEVEIRPLPAASHGTFWVGFGPGVEFANLSAHEVEVAEPREALTIPELLEANVGKRVRLEFASEFRTPLEGLLKSYPEVPEQPPVNLYMADVAPPQPPQAQVLLIEAPDGTVAINPASVDRIVFLEDPRTMVTDQHKRISLSGNLAKTGAGQALSVSYLAKGMTWAPSYLVDISDATKATLTAKASILNEIEDVEGAQVDLITGFPYLEFGEIISPLAKKEDLAAFLNALGRGASGGRRRPDYSGVTAQAMLNVAYRTEAEEPGPPVPEYGAAAVGTTAEDLFLYPMEGVSLKRGAVGYYPLFIEKVDYEHVYVWDIPDYIVKYWRNRWEEEPEPPPQIVWHSLRLQNGTGMPWTTAPATTMQKGSILGQSVLNYTPKGGDTLVKITQALGIKAEQVELELSRVPNAFRYRGDQYDRVTIEGTLGMRNHMDKDVTVEVNKSLSGEVESSAPEPKIKKLATYTSMWGWNFNPRCRLTWRLPLAAGKELEIKYTYKVLLRHW